MKKSTKKSLMGIAVTATATVLGLVVWTLADGEQKTKQAKEKLKEAA